MEADTNKKFSDSSIHNNRKEALLKRQAERKKSERNGTLPSNLSEVEKFTEIFNKKQKTIEGEIESLQGVAPKDVSDLSNRIIGINNEIQELQKLYSNSTLFLRIYDKKIFQESLQGLQTKLQHLETQLVPKKKFGFKVKKNNVEVGDIKFTENESETGLRIDNPVMNNFVGISNKTNEELILTGDKIKNRDIVLKDLKNCCVRIEGVPSTLHATNVDRCQFFFGPITTSVFVENMQNSVSHLACQQLRIHDTFDSEFYVHVTSKSVIENCKDVRFGIYNLNYEGIDSDYEISGLNRKINNWDQVDDFNWLITNKPSPNWSKLT